MHQSELCDSNIKTNIYSGGSCIVSNNDGALDAAELGALFQKIR